MTEIIQIVGMSFSFFLALVFIRKRKFLYYGIVFLCCGLILLEKYFWQTEYIYIIPAVAEVFVPLSFSIPVWLLLGHQSFILIKSKIKWVLPIIPILPYLNFLPLYASSFEYKKCYIQYEITDYLPDDCNALTEWAPTLISDGLLDFVLIIEFVFLLVFLLNSIEGKASSGRSDKTKLVSNKWSMVLLAIVCFVLASTIIGILFIPKTVSLASYTLPIIGLLVSFIIINNSALFQDIVKSKTYVGLSENDTKDLYRAIEDALNEEKYYSDNELTLVRLAQELDISTNKLSFVLNSKGTSFRNLLNSIRIEKATKFMEHEDSQRFSIEGIAIMFGYKSKSTFYQNFKKQHSKTPKEFIKEYQNGSKT